MTSFLYHPLFVDFFTIFLLISIGHFMRRSHFITDSSSQFLNDFCIYFTLPCMIIVSFMKDASPSDLTNGINIILWAIFIHITFFVLSYYFYKFQNLSSDDKVLLRNILPLGNISFFGIAMVSLLYQQPGIFAANMYGIVNRVLLYTVCFISISGLTLTKKDILRIIKNPALITSTICTVIFFTQEYHPQITIDNTTLSILRIDHSLPFFFQSIQKIGSLLTTLIWLTIGASITKESFNSLFKTPYALFFSLQKIILLPFLGIAFYALLHHYTGFSIGKEFLPATLILLITPCSTTLALFSLKYEKSPNLCIACLLASTIMCLIAFPFYAFILDWLVQNAII